MKTFHALTAAVAALVIIVVVNFEPIAFAAEDLPTKFSNQGTIGNTRHNLTQKQSSGSGPTSAVMEPYRNNYGEICVYCHTPHGANDSIKAPLWNRSIKATTYTTYNQLNTTVNQVYKQPGAASIVCLSCHDGQQAIDAIMNMPGSGKYSTNPNDAFLDTWQANPSGFETYVHAKLAPEECLACHAPVDSILSAGATDFTVAVIGTDLRNDHPVGVTFPTTTGSATDWKTPNGSVISAGLTTKFFDENSNGRMDKAEIRMYDSGSGASVECASCHDPHGVPSGGAGSTMNPTFLRKTNQNSTVCLTCHSK